MNRIKHIEQIIRKEVENINDCTLKFLTNITVTNILINSPNSHQLLHELKVAMNSYGDYGLVDHKMANDALKKILIVLF